MTDDLLERLARDFAATTDLELRLAEPGTASEPLPLAAPRAWRLVPQGSGDLGARLRRAVRDAAERRVRLGLIGADAPLLPAGLIESGFAALDRADAALAPAEDGGYVLFALATDSADPARFDPLFRRIPWGTPEVASATRAAARAAGLTLHSLPAHWDVDRPADLARLETAIRRLPPSRRPTRTAAFLTSRAPESPPGGGKSA